MEDDSTQVFKSRFPALDDPRTSDAVRRSILDIGDDLEPYVPAGDLFVSMPTRVVHNTGAGIVLEVGPYDLSAVDVLRLHRVITEFFDVIGFDAAVTA